MKKIVFSKDETGTAHQVKQAVPPGAAAWYREHLLHLFSQQAPHVLKAAGDLKNVFADGEKRKAEDDSP